MTSSVLVTTIQIQFHNVVKNLVKCPLFESGRVWTLHARKSRQHALIFNEVSIGVSRPLSHFKTEPMAQSGGDRITIVTRTAWGHRGR